MIASYFGATAERFGNRNRATFEPSRSDEGREYEQGSDKFQIIRVQSASQRDCDHHAKQKRADDRPCDQYPESR